MQTIEVNFAHKNVERDIRSPDRYINISSLWSHCIVSIPYLLELYLLSAVEHSSVSSFTFRKYKSTRNARRND